MALNLQELTYASELPIVAPYDIGVKGAIKGASQVYVANRMMNNALTILNTHASGFKAREKESSMVTLAKIALTAHKSIEGSRIALSNYALKVINKLQESKLSLVENTQLLQLIITNCTHFSGYSTENYVSNAMIAIKNGVDVDTLNQVVVYNRRSTDTDNALSTVLHGIKSHHDYIITLPLLLKLVETGVHKYDFLTRKIGRHTYDDCPILATVLDNEYALQFMLNDHPSIDETPENQLIAVTKTIPILLIEYSYFEKRVELLLDYLIRNNIIKQYSIGEDSEGLLKLINNLFYSLNAYPDKLSETYDIIIEKFNINDSFIREHTNVRIVDAFTKAYEIHSYFKKHGLFFGYGHKYGWWGKKNIKSKLKLKRTRNNKKRSCKKKIM